LIFHGNIYQCHLLLYCYLNMFWHFNHYYLFKCTYHRMILLVKITTLSQVTGFTLQNHSVLCQLPYEIRVVVCYLHECICFLMTRKIYVINEHLLNLFYVLYCYNPPFKRLYILLEIISCMSKIIFFNPFIENYFLHVLHLCR
jgi:hypothetical protein